MKLIVAVLFLTAWTFVTADDSTGSENRGLWETLFPKARDEVENPEGSEVKKRDCHESGEFCGIPGVKNGLCCSQSCALFCTPKW
nr:TPA_inf: conotoxin precursor O1 [Conus judaeus]